MLHLIFVVFLGWVVSFLGQLPLGTMSITSTQIAVSESFKNAWKYSIGVALVEIIYLRLVLKGVDWILQHRLFFMVLGWLTVVFFLGLGIASFISAAKQKEDKKALLLNNKLNRFFLGITMSALNPAQIPFWFIWSSYVMDLNLLNSSTTEFNLFTLGSGIGTISGLALYMYGGNYLITKMNASTKTMNKIMGIIFFIAGLAQLWRMLFEKVV
ncbi:MAG: lysine transporter LysE [Chitinophaga sp.]|jgi:threonine/homoserine/homoserine lactone efflux protein|nr:lysine transporter LysE [Chitinophaga sp.]